LAAPREARVKKPWYAGGLRFECTLCGNCCSGEPGFVWIDPEEEALLSRFLGLAVDAFRAQFTRVVGDRRSLVERANGDCVFLDERRRCRVHRAKPRQCLTYPFWRRIVDSPEAWEAEARRCPGIGAGRLHDAREIERRADPRTPRKFLAEERHAE
jgi:Fe-S-cluster containining protein